MCIYAKFWKCDVQQPNNGTHICKQDSTQHWSFSADLLFLINLFSSSDAFVQEFV